MFPIPEHLCPFSIACGRLDESPLFFRPSKWHIVQHVMVDGPSATSALCPTFTNRLEFKQPPCKWVLCPLHTLATSYPCPPHTCLSSVWQGSLRSVPHISASSSERLPATSSDSRSRLVLSKIFTETCRDVILTCLTAKAFQPVQFAWP